MAKIRHPAVSQCVRARFDSAVGVSHESPRAQTCTFESPGLPKNHQNSTIRHQRQRKRTKMGAGEGKKRNFGRSGGGRSGGRVSGVGVSRRRVVRRVQTNNQHQHTTTHNNTQPTTSPTTHNTTQQHKNGIGQNWIGQSRPNHLPLTTNIAKNGLAKIGLAKVGHNRGLTRRGRSSASLPELVPDTSVP